MALAYLGSSAVAPSRNWIGMAEIRPAAQLHICRVDCFIPWPVDAVGRLVRNEWSWCLQEVQVIPPPCSHLCECSEQEPTMYPTQDPVRARPTCHPSASDAPRG